MRTSFKVNDKGQGHQADIILRPEMRHIFRTNFKLAVQMEDDGPYHQQGQSLRSRCHVVRLTGVGP